MDSFLNKPDFPNLQLFINNFGPIQDPTGDMAVLYQKFNENINLLNQNPNNVQALQGVINYVTEYKEHFLNMPVVIGASGAIYGLLLAFGMLFPNSLIYLYFFIPMKAKWFVIIFGIIELVSGFYDTGGNVAHFAHLGGMVFGFFLILYWNKRDKRKRSNQWN